MAHCLDSECDFIKTVNAEEAARLAEERNDDGVLPGCRAGEAFELCSEMFVGATLASSVEASSDIDVSLVSCGGAVVSAGVSLVGEGAKGVDAGEHDCLRTASS